MALIPRAVLAASCELGACETDGVRYKSTPLWGTPTQFSWRASCSGAGLSVLQQSAGARRLYGLHKTVYPFLNTESLNASSQLRHFSAGNNGGNLLVQAHRAGCLSNHPKPKDEDYSPSINYALELNRNYCMFTRQ